MSFKEERTKERRDKERSKERTRGRKAKVIGLHINMQ